MARRRRLPSSRAPQSGSNLATIAVMTALLVVLLGTQRTVSSRLGDVFADVTEGSAAPTPPERQTVRVASDDPEVARAAARSAVHRASSGARTRITEGR